MRDNRPATPGERLSAGLTIESLLYVGILVIAIITRFWDLGSRALHHDESLHTYFSWLYSDGLGYQHDPLMHGPFLFHANALMYILFGSSDYVSRIMPAVAGVIVVMLPWFLRGDRLLGRWGALIASALILISPSILFYSRFIRHDLYALLGTFLLFIAIARYVDRPEPRWAILGGAATGFLITTKEVSFIVLFIFAAFIGLAVMYRSARELLAVGAGAVLLTGGLVLAYDRLYGIPHLPDLGWRNPSAPEIFRFTVDFLIHPIIALLIAVALLSLVASVWLLNRRRDPDRGWIRSILGGAETGSTSAALRNLILDRRTLLISAAAGLTIYTVLYTSLFTNMVGIMSGTAGALGYWLSQHDVQRGEQPWFYYLILAPQYEFFAVLFLVPVALWQGRRWLHARKGNLDLSHRDYTRILILFWGLMMLAILSWAGEKMPWLVVHIALPLILLAAAGLGEMAEWVERRRSTGIGRPTRDSLALAAGVAGLLITGFLVMAWATAGPFVQDGGQWQRTLEPAAADRWWIVYLPGLLMIGLLAYGVIRLGARRALVSATFALAGLLVLAQVHAGWRMTYQEGDVPRDMLIYVQTSPDVTRVTDELKSLSQETTGGLGLEVWYDSGTQWPFNWYLHEFPNRRYFGSTLEEQPTAPIILLSRENAVADGMEEMLEGYTFQEYSMRWWYPELEGYRRFAIAFHLNEEGRQNYQTDDPPPYSAFDVIASVGRSLWSLHEPEQQAKVFRLVAFRELPAPIDSYRFRVYVRNDMLPYVNDLRY